MESERVSLLNYVVNFLLEENYLLTAFELLHELIEDGRDSLASRLKEFFADSAMFPPDQISKLHASRVVDTQSLLKEKETAEEKVAIAEYELRLAQEDILKLKTELEKRIVAPSNGALNGEEDAITEKEILTPQQAGNERKFSNLGPIKDEERRVLNLAVKDFLISAGYKLTAMTFYEEVTDQNLDNSEKEAASVPDALRRYYIQYMSSSVEAAEERIAITQERENLIKEKDVLLKEIESHQRSKEKADIQLSILSRSLEAAQKEIKEKDKQIRSLKDSLEQSLKENNECRSEITSLKLQLDGSRAAIGWDNSTSQQVAFHDKLTSYQNEVEKLQLEINSLKLSNSLAAPTEKAVDQSAESTDIQQTEMMSDEDKKVAGLGHDTAGYSKTLGRVSSYPHIESVETLKEKKELLRYSSLPPEHLCVDFNIGKDMPAEIDNQDDSHATSGLEAVQVLADALPKIVPYVLINHREELLPLIICAIERHPDSDTRDALTHTLFNVIKRPDEEQRKIIMDACVSLSKSVGEMRTETELLPQCWEQINHKYEERRLLVAQSCGELSKFVRPEIRNSLILSIIQQLVEDPAAVVRGAAACNLALLLPLLPNMDKYFKVEELMFQLVCDPSGSVVEISLKELVPAVINWGRKLDHILRVLLSHLLACAQQCPPISGVENSIESHLRMLGEKERWNIDVLLRMLIELVPILRDTAIETCPFPNAISYSSEAKHLFFSKELLEMYSREYHEWQTFDWLHVDCLPVLIQLASFLPAKEDNLRSYITKFVLSLAENFGESYLRGVIHPMFLAAVGEDPGLLYMPTSFESRVRSLKPKGTRRERLATICVLPILLTGVLGFHSRKSQLYEYLHSLILRTTLKRGAWTPATTPDLIDAVRFLCTFQEHHGTIISVLWDMVVSTNANVKISAVTVFKLLVAYANLKLTSTQILPALITLGSDPNLNVKYSSIDAFGAVAQHFKDDLIVDKIRVQMDAFLEDGSHEAAISVIRALAVAVPVTTDKLRDYLLHKLLQVSSNTSSGTDLIRRREKSNAICEAIRALDGTDISPVSVRELLLPTIQNLLKETDSLDPAHKEALEIIVRERAGGALETLSKVMGSHLSMSTVSNLFGESGLLGKKDIADASDASGQSMPVPEDNRFKRIMFGNFSEIIRGKGKISDEAPHSSPR